jgi:nucleotide-binding universal stress UspA family protein
MLRVKRILFPTDFSPTSDAALATACHWARKLDAELHLFHTLESLRPDLYPAALGLADPAIVSLSIEEMAHKELEERRRQASNQGAVVTVAAVEGLSAAPTLLDYAETHDIDLIAMSTHGRRGVRRLLLGSVAEEVVQRSTCPVLTIGAAAKSGHSLSPQRILVAVDLSDHSAAPVAHAKHLASLFQAEMQLLHVLVRSPLPAYYDGAAVPNLVFDSPLLEKEAQSALEKLYEDADGPAGPVSMHVEHGLAVEQILRFASANSSDLVVVASHGLTGVSHLLMGSVAERVVRQASCPVLAFKSFGKSLIAEPAPARVVAQG